MASAREHLKNTHGAEQSHWSEFAKGLGELGSHAEELHKKSGMCGESDVAADCYKLQGLAQAHSDYHGTAFEECSKAQDSDEMHKRAQQAEQERLNAVLQPTNISAVHPDVTPVPRFGQPQIATKLNVPREFEKVFAIDEE